jgi:hypothetical protein
MVFSETIADRKGLIREVMNQFNEMKGNDYAFLAGFYSQMLADLAADKLSDTEDVLRTIRYTIKNFK